MLKAAPAGHVRIFSEKSTDFVYFCSGEGRKVTGRFPNFTDLIIIYIHYKESTNVQ